MFMVSALLCVSSPAMSELEGPAEESSSSGLHGHTIIRTYGAIVPAVLNQALEHAGWGTGLAVSYGVGRAIQLSLGLAYYQFQYVVKPDVDCDCLVSIQDAVRQTTISVDAHPPTRSWLRPWLGVGLGIYETTKTPRWSHSWICRYADSGTRLGVNWGLGVSARLDQRLAIDLGGRYHTTYGRPFLETTGYWAGLDMFTAQAGLSYVVH